jgi:hypothetical protein
MFFVQTKNRGHFPFQKDKCPHVICRDRFPNGPFGERTLHLREEKRGQSLFSRGEEKRYLVPFLNGKVNENTKRFYDI